MTIAGIDVSAAGQGADFNWAAWRGKIGFAAIKISEGTGYADPYAKRNIAGARSIGCAVIGYHFLHAVDGAPQARWYLECAAKAGMKPGDNHAVDCEDLGLLGQTAATMDLVAAGFAGELRKHYQPGWNPVCYTEISMARELAHMGSCPLWLANPSRMAVKSIGPWKQVSFEQVGQRGVDSDVFYGTSEQLAALAFR